MRMKRQLSQALEVVIPLSTLIPLVIKLVNGFEFLGIGRGYRHLFNERRETFTHRETRNILNWTVLMAGILLFRRNLHHHRSHCSNDRFFVCHRNDNHCLFTKTKDEGSLLRSYEGWLWNHHIMHSSFDYSDYLWRWCPLIRCIDLTVRRDDWLLVV